MDLFQVMLERDHQSLHLVESIPVWVHGIIKYKREHSKFPEILNFILIVIRNVFSYNNKKCAEHIQLDTIKPTPIKLYLHFSGLIFFYGGIGKDMMTDIADVTKTEH